MKLKEFKKIMFKAMESLEARHDFTCNLIGKAQFGDDKILANREGVECDYAYVFDVTHFSFIERELMPLGKIYPQVVAEVWEMRKNALAMYYAQSLAFKTYEEL